jgi:hypothetical protein
MKRLLLLGLSLPACRANIDGSWELVDATWTALEYESGSTVRTTEAFLELTADGPDIKGSATLRQTTRVGDQPADEQEETAPIDGEYQGDDIWLPAPPLFDIECKAKNDLMVCIDGDGDDWEFARTGK